MADVHEKSLLTRHNILFILALAKQALFHVHREWILRMSLAWIPRGQRSFVDKACCCVKQARCPRGACKTPCNSEIAIGLCINGRQG